MFQHASLMGDTFNVVLSMKVVKVAFNDIFGLPEIPIDAIVTFLPFLQRGGIVICMLCCWLYWMGWKANMGLDQLPSRMTRLSRPGGFDLGPSIFNSFKTFESMVRLLTIGIRIYSYPMFELRRRRLLD